MRIGDTRQAADPWLHTPLLSDALSSESKEPFLPDPWNHKRLAGRARSISRNNMVQAAIGLVVLITSLCDDKVLEKRAYKEKKSILT